MSLYCQRNRFSISQFKSKCNVLPGFFFLDYVFVWLLITVMVFGCQKVQVQKKPSTVPGPTQMAQQFRYTMMILADDKSEKTLGRFPWTRKHLIHILPKLARARLVVIGFSMDQKSSYLLDKKLEAVISANKNVLLQARLAAKGVPENSKHLAYRDLPYIQGTYIKNNGRFAWLPYLALADAARGIGFVTTNSVKTNQDFFPLALRFGDNPYPTMQLAVYKEYHNLPRKSIYAGKNFLYLGNKKLPIQALNRMKNEFLDQRPESFSFVDVLQDKIDPAVFADKVVVIGYEFSRLHRIRASRGKISPTVLMTQRIETLLQHSNK